MTALYKGKKTEGRFIINFRHISFTENNIIIALPFSKKKINGYSVGVIRSFFQDLSIIIRLDWSYV